MHQVQIDTPTPAGPPPALPPADPRPGGRFTPPAIARTACGNDRHSLRARFLRAGSDAVDDRELLELLLSRFHAAGNAGVLAASLLDTFGSPARVLAAHPDRLRSVDGLSEAGVCAIKTAEALGIRLARAELPERLRPGFDNYGKVLDYCRTLTGHKPVGRVGPKRLIDLTADRFLRPALRTGRAPFVMHPALQRLSRSQEPSSI